MSELALLEETVAGLVGREHAWAELEQSGLTRAGLADEGGGLAEAAAVVRAAARRAAPLPVAETVMLGAWLLAEAGLEVPSGPLAATADPGLRLDGDALRGEARAVAWARDAERLVVLVDGRVALVDPAAAEIRAGANLAGEPRDDLVLRDGVRVEAAPVALDAAAFRRRGALARAVAIAGALETVLDLTVAYARQREQFGRPIGRFQAVQQQLAELAGEVAAARAAADAAVERPDALHVAAAKLRAGEAASRSAAIAHQLHGAIGVTQEYALHRFTLRLWSWRDEFGSEEEWAIELGRLAAAAGPDGLWTLLAAV